MADTVIRPEDYCTQMWALFRTHAPPAVQVATDGALERLPGTPPYPPGIGWLLCGAPLDVLLEPREGVYQSRGAPYWYPGYLASITEAFHVRLLLPPGLYWILTPSGIAPMIQFIPHDLLISYIGTTFPELAGFLSGYREAPTFFGRLWEGATMLRVDVPRVEALLELFLCRTGDPILLLGHALDAWLAYAYPRALSNLPPPVMAGLPMVPGSWNLLASTRGTTAPALEWIARTLPLPTELPAPAPGEISPFMRSNRSHPAHRIPLSSVERLEHFGDAFPRSRTFR